MSEVLKNRLPINFMRDVKGTGITMGVSPIKCSYMMGASFHQTYWKIQKSQTEKNGSSLAYSFRFCAKTYYAPTLKQAKELLQAEIDRALEYEN